MRLNVEPLNSEVEPLSINIEPLNSEVEPLSMNIEPLNLKLSVLTLIDLSHTSMPNAQCPHNYENLAG
ncbi:MAG: hypothetical protein V7K53_05810 [Nostoc sp.]|uniref:hypothetical protein n=1 Tax=Nostoc sp. TaxID=1180 RepID=UPI002FF76040